MLKFDDTFFDEELEYGFPVSEKMKRVRAADLEVLRVIDEVCLRNGIEYFADYGTLLGVVRHQGFIPWDDDVDIAMRRRDFNEFFNLPDSEFPEGFVRIGKGYPMQPMGAVLNTSQVNFSPEHLEKYHGCPYIVGTDVFPLDDVPDDEELRKNYTYMYNMFYDAAKRFDEINEKEGIELYLPVLEELGGFTFDRASDLKEQLWTKTRQIAELFKGERGEYISYLPDLIGGAGERVLRKRSYYDNVLRLPFENITLPVPQDFDAVLRLRFGDNYMMPQRGGAAHDYPMYKKQDEWIMAQRRAQGIGEEVKIKASPQIYNPAFLLDEPKADDENDLAYYREMVLSDEVLNAKRLVLQSENMKQPFINILTKETDVPAKEWSAKIEVKPGPYGEKRQESSEKKIIAYEIMPGSFLAYEKEIIAKIRNTLKIFEENKDDIVLRWVIHPGQEELRAYIDETVFAEYEKILKECEKKDWIIIDKDTDGEKLAKECDAFYGDMCDEIYMFKLYKKPIMIQDCRI